MLPYTLSAQVPSLADLACVRPVPFTSLVRVSTTPSAAHARAAARRKRAAPFVARLLALYEGCPDLAARLIRFECAVTRNEVCPLFRWLAVHQKLTVSRVHGDQGHSLQAAVIALQ